jgi:hypothetical protein
MVLVIRGVLGNQNLSGYVDMDDPVRIEAATGQRQDTLELTLFDPDQELVIPPKAEIIIYDFPPGDLPPGWTAFPALFPVVDPSPPNLEPLGYTYDTSNVYDSTDPTTTGYYDLAPPLPAELNPLLWTPRRFAGYVATAEYVVTAGLQRQIKITATDYTTICTYRICNRAYAPDSEHPLGWTDQEMVRQLFNIYAPEIDTYDVSLIMPAGVMPTISFPVHTLSQMMQRVCKLTQAYFRVDYYKRLHYGPIGYQMAPFDIDCDVDTNLMATPPTVCAEGLSYSPDASNLVDRVWVVGATFHGAAQDFPLANNLWDGATQVALLPSQLLNAATVAVSINGVDQGFIGVLGTDGTLDDFNSFKYNVLVGLDPPTVAFKVPPPLNANIVVTGTFTYPLLQVVSDDSVIASLNGLILEKVVRDRRIDSQQQATAVGQGFLSQQKSAKPMGQCVIHESQLNGAMLQPGQSLNVTSKACFGGGVLGHPTHTLKAYITQISTELTQQVTQPWQVTVSFSDRPDQMDDDILEMFIGEQGRVNAALQQTQVDQIFTDFVKINETIGFQPDGPGHSVITHGDAVYDNAGSTYEFSNYSMTP